MESLSDILSFEERNYESPASLVMNTAITHLVSVKRFHRSIPAWIIIDISGTMVPIEGVKGKKRPLRCERMPPSLRIMIVSWTWRGVHGNNALISFSGGGTSTLSTLALVLTSLWLDWWGMRNSYALINSRTLAALGSTVGINWTLPNGRQ